MITSCLSLLSPFPQTPSFARLPMCEARWGPHVSDSSKLRGSHPSHEHKKPGDNNVAVDRAIQPILQTLVKHFIAAKGPLAELVRGPSKMVALADSNLTPRGSGYRVIPYYFFF